jgi:hypothetical protein
VSTNSPDVRTSSTVAQRGSARDIDDVDEEGNASGVAVGDNDSGIDAIAERLARKAAPAKPGPPMHKAASASGRLLVPRRDAGAANSVGAGNNAKFASSAGYVSDDEDNDDDDDDGGDGGGGGGAGAKATAASASAAASLAQIRKPAMAATGRSSLGSDFDDNAKSAAKAPKKKRFWFGGGGGGGNGGGGSGSDAAAASTCVTVAAACVAMNDRAV